LLNNDAKQLAAASLTDLTATLQANTVPLQLLHQGFAYPYLQPPIRSFSDSSPYLAKGRSLARFLGVVAYTRERQGDWDGSLQATLDGIKLGEDIPRGGVIISLLVGIAFEAIARDRCWARIGHLDAPGAQAAARRLETILANHVTLAEVYQEDEWATQSQMLALFQKPNWRKEFVSMLGDGSSQGSAILLYGTSKRTVIRGYTRYMDALITRAKLPFIARGAAPPEPSNPIARAIVPVMAGAESKAAENEARNALLLLALALQAYKAEHGSYPATLDALVPIYLKKLPDDPFAKAGPPVYQRKGATYLLYSIGPDGKDDGGKPINTQFLQRHSLGDIVAGTTP
jgi:hypothetical protein